MRLRLAFLGGENFFGGEPLSVLALRLDETAGPWSRAVRPVEVLKQQPANVRMSLVIGECVTLAMELGRDDLISTMLGVFFGDCKGMREAVFSLSASLRIGVAGPFVRTTGAGDLLKFLTLG